MSHVDVSDFEFSRFSLSNMFLYVQVRRRFVGFCLPLNCDQMLSADIDLLQM